MNNNFLVPDTVTNNVNVADTTVHNGLDPNWQVKSTYSVSFKRVYTVGTGNPFPPSDTVLNERKSLTLAFRNVTNRNSLGIGEESETEGSNIVPPNFLMTNYHHSLFKNKLLKNNPARWSRKEDIKPKETIELHLEQLYRRVNPDGVGLTKDNKKKLFKAYINFQTDMTKVAKQYANYYIQDCFRHLCEEKRETDKDLCHVLPNHLGEGHTWKECLDLR